MKLHQHRIDKDRFLAQMNTKGWCLDSNGSWIVPPNRRIHQREVDWLEAIVGAIECECPHEHKHTDTCYSKVPETEGLSKYLSCGKVAGDIG